MGVVFGGLTPISSSSLMCFFSAISSRPVQPAITNSVGWNVIRGHEVVDDFVIVRPRSLAEIMVAHDEGRAGVELLVLQVAAGELRADQVPGELVELHALERAQVRGLPVRL